MNGQLQLNFARFSMFNVLKMMRDVMEFQTKQKGLKLNIRINFKEQQAEAYTDMARLLQVLTNLLGNALKFTFQGSITLTVKRVVREGLRLFQIIVEDTGIGITEQMQKRLFQL